MDTTVKNIYSITYRYENEWVTTFEGTRAFHVKEIPFVLTEIVNAVGDELTEVNIYKCK